MWFPVKRLYPPKANFLYSQLQKSWRNETRAVNVNGTMDFNMAPLPLEELQDVLPQLTDCLKQYDIPGSLQAIALANEDNRYYPPFAHNLSQSSDFWNLSGEGDEYSELGCFP